MTLFVEIDDLRVFRDVGRTVGERP